MSSEAAEKKKLEKKCFKRTIEMKDYRKKKKLEN